MVVTWPWCQNTPSATADEKLSGWSLQPFRPSAGTVQDGENLDPVGLDAIRDQKWRSRHDKLSRPGHAPLPPEVRVPLQDFDRR